MRIKPIFQLHSAVLLFGFAGLLGKLITESPVVIVFGRTFLAACVLFVILMLHRESIAVFHRKDAVGFFSMGVLLAVHWLSFFQAIRVSTVAIGLLTYASFPVFVMVIEPIVFQKLLRKRDILYALAVMIGLLVIIPEYNFRNSITIGVLWGILSGFSFALLTVLNKRYSTVCSPLKIAFYQDGIASLILLPWFLLIPKDLSVGDVGYLLVLGIFCTAIAHTLFISSMRQVRAFTAGIAAALEPVYGVILALIALGEVPSSRTLIGGLIILGIVGVVTGQSD